MVMDKEVDTIVDHVDIKYSDDDDGEEALSLLKEIQNDNASSLRKAQHYNDDDDDGISFITVKSPFNSCWTTRRIIASIVVSMTLLLLGFTFWMDETQENNNKVDTVKDREGHYKNMTDLSINDNDLVTPTNIVSKSSTKEQSTSKDGDNFDLLTSEELKRIYDSIENGYRPHPDLFSYSYVPRGRELNETARQRLMQQWGSWNMPLADDHAIKARPNIPFDDYPNRDIPWSKFPQNAWQTDTTYLSKFLPEAIALVDRAMEAILSEYGHGKLDEPNKTFDERANMFELLIRTGPGGKRSYIAQGGWTTPDSVEILVKRVLHAVVTEDTFTVIMGGHSAAAGHGNNFLQSYMMAFQRIMEPIWARLGVYFRAHNMGMGGLGTIQNGLASSDMYGNDIDILFWHSGMTEGGAADQDMFIRQALLGARRIPAFWGGDNGRVLVNFHDMLGLDIAEIAVMWMCGFSGIPKSTSSEQVKTLPWATQYLSCERGFGECGKHKYSSKCWIDRDDFTPTTKQQGFPGGRASWHPGDKEHQLVSRILAMNILKPLFKALNIWNNAENYELPDDAWHLTSHYNQVRSKLKAQNVTQTFCAGTKFPSRACQIPIRARSEMYPHRNPIENSIRSIAKNDLPEPLPNAYDPPDVRLSTLDPPEGHVDVLSIVENGTPFRPERYRIASANSLARHYQNQKSRLPVTSGLEPGKGWHLDTISNPDTCDGSYYSFCGRDKNSNCLLYGHNDNRGGLVFDGYSGWLIVQLDNMQNGFIAIKMGVPHAASPQTLGWCGENKFDESCTQKEPDGSKRRLESACDDFRFEFAINGKITSWNNQEWGANMRNVQRVVQVWVLLDDEDHPKGDIELAIRITGCGRDLGLILNHIYWS